MNYRVYVLAHENGLESKPLMLLLRSLGYTVKSPSSMVTLMPVERDAILAVAKR
jgi:hypothetical protein